MNLNCTIRVKQQLNTEHVTGLHDDVWGDFSGLRGDVSKLKGDVTCIYGNADNVTEEFDATGKYGGVSFFSRRKPVSH